MDTDAALAARLARDLDGAFPSLVDGHADRLFTMALRSLGDRRDAEEVAQDALVRAYRAIATYPPDRIRELRLRPWLASIAVNLMRNRRRNLADRFPPTTLDGLVEGGFDPADARAIEPASLAEARAGAEELGLLLLQLPGHLRAAVVLRHVDGLSVAETAAALGRPEGTVKAQVSRGLERLRLLLAASGRGAGTRSSGGARARPPAASAAESVAGSSRRASRTPTTTRTTVHRRDAAAAEVLP
jgi:RNA polymerase sigma factor (sigma-70 family)